MAVKKDLVPEHVKHAAKQGFIRTASQSLATSLGLVAGITYVFTQDALVAAAAGVGGMVVGAIVNGLQSYFSILSKGIPEAYQAGGGSDGELPLVLDEAPRLFEDRE